MKLKLSLENKMAISCEKTLKLFRKSFSFLIEEFGFKEKSSKLDNWGVQITFCNLTTGIRVSYEPREGGYFVLLMRLVNGEVPEHPIHIDDDTVLNRYYLEDLLSIREADYEKKQLERINKKQKDEDTINDLAYCLKITAEDVLQGDFSTFSELEKIVKDRARVFR
jgi:hypothetical protein